MELDHMPVSWDKETGYPGKYLLKLCRQQPFLQQMPLSPVFSAFRLPVPRYHNTEVSGSIQPLSFYFSQKSPPAVAWVTLLIVVLV